VEAARGAISNRLLEASIEGARGVLISISGASDLGLFEISEAARMVQGAVHPNANIIFGTSIDDTLGDEVRVTVIAAGFDGGAPPSNRDTSANSQRIQELSPIAAATAKDLAREGEAPTIPVAHSDVSSNQAQVADDEDNFGNLFGDAPVEPVAVSSGPDDLDVPDFLR
jgi:cell division protein FtsZ